MCVGHEVVADSCTSVTAVIDNKDDGNNDYDFISPVVGERIGIY